MSTNLNFSNSSCKHDRLGFASRDELTMETSHADEFDQDEIFGNPVSAMAKLAEQMLHFANQLVLVTSNLQSQK